MRPLSRTPPKCSSLAEERGVTLETSGDIAPTVGSLALLLQMTTNLVHNAIVHNLPTEVAVWATSSVHPDSAVLTVENTGELPARSWFHSGLSRSGVEANASAPTTQASVSAWRSTPASPKPTTEHLRHRLNRAPSTGSL